MIYLYPFLFRFGVSFNYDISKNINVLTSNISKKFNIDIGIPNIKKTNYCISITDDEAKKNAQIISDRFNQRCQEYKINNFDEAIIFIDLKDAYSDKFIDSFINNILSNLIKSPNPIEESFPHIIVLVKNLEEGSLTFDNIFRYYVSHHALGHCFLLFDTKGLYFDKTTLGLQYDSELHELVNGISKSSLEKFEFKLIRKINHFKKNENNRWAACQYFFYDINDGGDETYNVLKDELAFFDINPHYIIFDARNSKWLQNSIKSLSNTISSDGFDEYSNYKADHLIDINADDWKEDRKVVDTAYHIIFISDLIDSGTTFKRSYKSIQKKFPNSSVKCLSVLITEKAFKNNGGIEDGRTISIEGINVRYIKKVKQTIMRRTANRNECVLCRYNLLPPVETSEPIGRELSSFEMWMMSEEAGYKIEDYPPRSGRKKIIIPDSLEIFRRNAALVALKFQKRIEDLQIISNEYVIVFPDERNNENNIRDIEDTPSGYFAKCLKFYNDNYNYLPVPREFIRLLDESNELFEEVSCKFSTTIHQIESIDDGVPIIIIDEINVTGRTFKTIVDILGCCGKRATCYFPIFDFNKSGMDKLIHEDRYSDIKYTNLYQLDLNYE